MLFLGGNEHSVKVSSNSEMVRAGVLFENFGDYRELILISYFYLLRKIRLGFSCESSVSQVLFSLKNNEKIFLNVVYCS